MRRTTVNLNEGWLFLPGDLKAAARPDCPEDGFVAVSLPHANVELPYHNFSEREYGFVSWYRRRLVLPPGAEGGRVLLDFDGAMTAAAVFVNGVQAGPEHRGGYTGFTRDVTELVHSVGENLVAVQVDSSERPDIPPFGGRLDYMSFGGLYRDVRLRVTGPVHLERLFARPLDVLSLGPRLEVTARVVNATAEAREVRAEATLRGPGGRTWRVGPTTATVEAGGEADLEFGLRDLAGVELWDLESPVLYDLEVVLEDGDALTARVGFRQAEFREDGGFHLNGRELKLRGLNRHQTYPYVGGAAPARLQRKDADILRFDLACNLVRTSHYPQSSHFLDRCDEIGLLVFEEIPGWQHVGDEAWKALALRDLEAMVLRDRNRPSVVLWGVRVNESPDDQDFYARTNALCRVLDPTRPTGGVRDRYESELLEDVFTMNDFQRRLRPPAASRYLNTEFCGHMFPAKTFDPVERALEHALYHADVLDQIGGMASAGGIGWCAFDYNTHEQFGSGDRVCYHGVMDIFRQPKLAAHLYASQDDPRRRVVLEPATYWKKDVSGGLLETTVFFSNVDEIEVFVGGTSRGRHRPARDRYPHLPHPPFVVRTMGGEWGRATGTLTVVGYLDGRPVVDRRMAADGLPVRLELTADDHVVIADGSDMTRLALRITDEFGNILPFAMQPVFLSLEGPGVLVGDNPFPMPGGRGAVYLRATREPGAITVTATTARLEPVSVTVESRRTEPSLPAYTFEAAR